MLSRRKSGFPVLVSFFSGYVFKLRKDSQTDRKTDWLEVPTLPFDDVFTLLPLADPSGNQTQAQDKQSDTAKHGNYRTYDSKPGN